MLADEWLRIIHHNNQYPGKTLFDGGFLVAMYPNWLLDVLCYRCMQTLHAPDYENWTTRHIFNKSHKSEEGDVNVYALDRLEEFLQCYKFYLANVKSF